MLDDHVRLVGIAGAELLKHGSAYLREPQLKNPGVENVAMRSCVNIGCGQVEVGVLECDGTLLKAWVNDLGENFGSSHGAQVGRSMIGGEIVGIAMAIDHLCTCAWQFNVIHRLDRFGPVWPAAKSAV